MNAACAYLRDNIVIIYANRNLAKHPSRQETRPRRNRCFRYCMYKQASANATILYGVWTFRQAAHNVSIVIFRRCSPSNGDAEILRLSPCSTAAYGSHRDAARETYAARDRTWTTTACCRFFIPRARSQMISRTFEPRCLPARPASRSLEWSQCNLLADS